MAKAGESSIVSKCARVMDIVSHARRPLVFSDIIEQTGFVKSSTHRILAVLQSEGMIEYDRGARTYRIGSRLNDWARSSWRRVDLQQIASEVMHTLSEDTGMNTALSVQDKDTILYLRTVDVVQFRYASHAGDHAPLYSTAAGKVFLAHMNDRQRDNIIDTLHFEKLTENTTMSVEALLEELELVRINGFAKALGEELVQVTGISAPIFDVEEKVTACLSLWSLTDQNSPDEIIAMSDKLISSTKQISGQLS